MPVGVIICYLPPFKQEPKNPLTPRSYPNPGNLHIPSQGTFDHISCLFPRIWTRSLKSMEFVTSHFNIGNPYEPPPAKAQSPAHQPMNVSMSVDYDMLESFVQVVTLHPYQQLNLLGGKHQPKPNHMSI